MLHQLFSFWFHLVQEWGYVGVFVLMAMESSIFPVPSELVIPPAAFWATQGKMSYWGVWMAALAGSYVGSFLTYMAASRFLGDQFLRPYKKNRILSQSQFQLGEKWVHTFGPVGVFFARLLPVLRHVISIPCGVFKMNVWSFSISTLLGAGIWCACLSWFGAKTIGHHPEILESSELLLSMMHQEVWHFSLFMAVLLLLTLFVMGFQKKNCCKKVEL